MAYQFIILEQRDKILNLKLNRPEKLNAICFEMVEEIDHAISNVNFDKITAVFIHGNEKAFSAGGDLTEMKMLEQTEAKRRSSFIHKTFQKIHNLPVPVIAFIRGICFGGGLELALHCDFRICSETARFAFPEVKYGMVPGAGGTVQFPIQINAATANYYLTTGDEFDAMEALGMQLIQKLITIENYQILLNEQERFYNHSDFESIRAIKETILQNRKKDLSVEYELEAELFSKLLYKNGRSGIKKNFK